jgi:isoleucyl-tRNA synthetase
MRALSQDSLAAYQVGEAVEIILDGATHTLEEGDLEVLQEAAGSLIVKGEGAFTLALDAELDDELRAEGVARELINRIQRLRKDAGLEITDRIEVGIGGPEGVQAAADTHRDFVGGETLAVRVVVADGVSESDFAHVRDVDLDGTPARIGLRPADV